MNITQVPELVPAIQRPYDCVKYTWARDMNGMVNLQWLKFMFIRGSFDASNNRWMLLFFGDTAKKKNQL